MLSTKYKCNLKEHMCIAPWVVFLASRKHDNIYVSLYIQCTSKVRENWLSCCRLELCCVHICIAPWVVFLASRKHDNIYVSLYIQCTSKVREKILSCCHLELCCVRWYLILFTLQTMYLRGLHTAHNTSSRWLQDYMVKHTHNM